MCSPVHDLCGLFAGACYEDAAVENDESEFEEAEGGRPGEFFDEECLDSVNAVILNWLRGFIPLKPSQADQWSMYLDPILRRRARWLAIISKAGKWHGGTTYKRFVERHSRPPEPRIVLVLCHFEGANGVLPSPSRPKHR